VIAAVRLLPYEFTQHFSCQECRGWVRFIRIYRGGSNLAENETVAVDIHTERP
jgi:hypothetical protein